MFIDDCCEFVATIQFQILMDVELTCSDNATRLQMW